MPRDDDSRAGSSGPQRKPLGDEGQPAATAPYRQMTDADRAAQRRLGARPVDGHGETQPGPSRVGPVDRSERGQPGRVDAERAGWEDTRARIRDIARDRSGRPVRGQVRSAYPPAPWYLYPGHSPGYQPGDDAGSGGLPDGAETPWTPGSGQGRLEGAHGGWPGPYGEGYGDGYGEYGEYGGWASGPPPWADRHGPPDGGGAVYEGDVQPLEDSGIELAEGEPAPLNSDLDRERVLAWAGSRRDEDQVDDGAEWADPVAGLDAPSEAGWFDGLRVELSATHWLYQPYDIKDQSADWARVETKEVYDIEPLWVYRAALQLDTRWARTQIAWQSNTGLEAGDGRMALLGLLVAFTGPIGERFSLELTHLDFEQGHVEMRDRRSDAVRQSARFATTLSVAEARFEVLAPLFIYGRYTQNQLPRNVYLAYQDPSFGTSYLPVSEQLLRIDTSTFAFGVGAANRRPLERDASPWTLGMRLGVGAGPYQIDTLSTGARLDEGSLMVAHLAGEIGYRYPLGHGFSIGARNELTLTHLQPLGLPDGVRKLLREEGLPADRCELAFGVVELVNQFRVELTWDW